MALGCTGFAAAAPNCDVNATAPATARTFAKTSERGAWREYSSIDDVPEMRLDSGMSAQIWQQKKGTLAVSIVQPGEHFWTETHYCFRNDGELEAVSFELRTTLGWGHRTQGTVESGTFNVVSEKFFNTKNGKAIPRPRGVGEAPAGLRPRLFLIFSKLPFASLLTDRMETRARPADAASTSGSGS